MKNLSTDKYFFSPEVMLSHLSYIEQNCIQQDFDPAHPEKNYLPEIYIFPNHELGNQLATRWAFRKMGSSLLQAEKCYIQNNTPTKNKANHYQYFVQKQVYSNNLTAIFQMRRKPICLTPANMGNKIEIKKLQLPGQKMPTVSCPWLKHTEMNRPAKPLSLQDAKIVLALGNGVKQKKQFLQIKKMAQSMGAEIGVSRVVAMRGWVSMQNLLGGSGISVSPELCIAAGVSGMAVFNIGIRQSSFIVAINTDPAAPIFGIADIGIIGDLHEILAELAKQIEKMR